MKPTYKFILPVKLNKQVKNNDKDVSLSSYQGDYVISPYKGIIEKTDINDCGGKVVIKHKLDNTIYYSKICGVNRISVHDGQKVDEGKIIGIVGNDPIVFNILSELKIKQIIKPFLDGIVNKEKQKEYKKLKKQNSPREKGFGDALIDLFTTVATTPFNVVRGDKIGSPKDLFTDDDPNQVTETLKLKEEIDRIKKLL